MRKLVIIIMAIIPMMWLVGLVVFDYKINNFYIDKTTKTDAVVVLTGGRHRLAEAVGLLNDGMAEILFVSGVQKDISLQELDKRYEIQPDVMKKIVLDRVASNTFENARETNEWIKKEQIKSIRLVTSNYHILRSLVEFRRWNKEIKIVLHPVFSEKVATSWWKSVYSFYFLAQEYNKFLFAKIRAMVCNV